MVENRTPQCILVMITAPSEGAARDIAQTLLEKKLAACVNLVPGIRSLYTWDGAVNDDNEVLLIAKSRAALFENQLVPAVQQLHPYDVPEIIAVPITMGSQSYLDWIEEVTIA
jgi:periplasmic divalent cation tolerance protein